MNIITVKLQASGYLVNGNIYVPNSEGNRHYQQVQEWLLSNTPEPELTQAGIDLNIARADKADRMAQIDTMTITTTSGKVFDADKPARAALTSAVAVGEAGMSTLWKLADNTVEIITWEELKEALLLLGAAHTALIAVAE